MPIIDQKTEASMLLQANEPFITMYVASHTWTIILRNNHALFQGLVGESARHIHQPDPRT
jgi:hypothetical protein